MPSRVLGSLALVLVAMAAAWFSHYGFRTLLPISLSSTFDLRTSEIAAYFSFSVVASVVGMLFAGALAYLIPPRLVAVAGALVAALGYFAFAIASTPAVAIAAMCFAELGAGMLMPSVYAYAGRVLTYEGETELLAPSGRRFLTMVTFLALASVLASLSALVSAPFFGALYTAFSARLTTLVAAVAEVVAAIAFGLSMLVDRESRAPSDARPQHTAYRTEPAANSDGARATDATVVLLALAFAVPGALGLLVTQSVEFGSRVEDASSFGMILSIAAAGNALCAIVVGVSFLVLAIRRAAFSIATVIGGGYLVVAAGGLLAVASSTFALRALAITILSSGQILFAIAIAYPAVAVRGRGATLATAGYLTIQTVGSLLVGVFASIPTVAAIGGAIVLVTAGTATIALRERVKSVLERA